MSGCASCSGPSGTASRTSGRSGPARRRPTRRCHFGACVPTHRANRSATCSAHPISASSALFCCRLHGAARRADVRSESEYDEEEYGEAVRSLAAVAGQVAAGCATGLRFPWAVRVRLCEILIGGEGPEPGWARGLGKWTGAPQG